MSWLHLLAYFFGGAFLSNFIPHFISGILGRDFPTPFASPPFRGLSPPRVNILYGLLNLAISYVLLSRIGTFDPRQALHAIAFGLGLMIMALFVASSLERSRRSGSSV